MAAIGIPLSVGIESGDMETAATVGMLNDLEVGLGWVWGV
jgi:hypothetical protein